MRERIRKLVAQTHIHGDQQITAQILELPAEGLEVEGQCPEYPVTEEGCQDCKNAYPINNDRDWACVVDGIRSRPATLADLIEKGPEMVKAIEAVQAILGDTPDLNLKSGGRLKAK